MDLTALISVGAALAFATGVVTAARSTPSGDANAGEAIYSRCAACRALAYDRTGPRHCGRSRREGSRVRLFGCDEALEDRVERKAPRPLPGQSVGSRSRNVNG